MIVVLIVLGGLGWLIIASISEANAEKAQEERRDIHFRKQDIHKEILEFTNDLIKDDPYFGRTPSKRKFKISKDPTPTEDVLWSMQHSFECMVKQGINGIRLFKNNYGQYQLQKEVYRHTEEKGYQHACSKPNDRELLFKLKKVLDLEIDANNYYKRAHSSSENKEMVRLLKLWIRTCLDIKRDINIVGNELDGNIERIGEASSVYNKKSFIRDIDSFWTK